jgi:FkbM family methyltransferase
MKLRHKLAHRLRYALLTYRFKGRDRLSSWIAAGLLPRARGEELLTTVYGPQLYVDPTVDHSIDRAIYDFGTYEPGTIAALRKLAPVGGNFVDVGANIGIIALSVGQRVGPTGKVYAFEPHPRTHQLLRRNISINEMEWVLPFEGGLGSVSETRSIHSPNERNRGEATLMQSDSVLSSAFQVQIRTLDQLWLEWGRPDIHALKIDTEGWELEVLKGSQALLSSANAPGICVEYVEGAKVQGGESFNVVEHICRTNTYRPYRLDRGKFEISTLKLVERRHDFPLHDNLFFLRSEHLKRYAQG